MAFEEILTNGVTEILNKLVPVVAQQISLAWGVKDDLRKLQKTMEMILAVVADAERRQVTEEAVRLWLRWLKDVAYDADDVLDEFSYETLRRGQRGDRLKHKFHDFVSSSNNPLVFAFLMAKKIKDINKRLDEITKDMIRFGLNAAAVNTSVVDGESSEQRSRQTASFINESETVGRMNDKTIIVDMLTKATTSSSSSSDVDLHAKEKVSVISIVGMGGLGKTTLAQLVYKDELVNKYFDQRIWVFVSTDFDVQKILVKIMESITLPKFDVNISNFDLLVKKVQEKLMGKKFLLVLDDLWNEDNQQWERLRSPLSVGAQGSKILITTRKTQVADVVKGSIRPYQLGKLPEDECWSIIEKRAFSPGGAVKTPNMINIVKEMAKKCSGLPLAAKFLGSLMHSKNKETDWLCILETDVWSIQEGQSEIRPILKLSYDNLAPRLKQCFSYCSIFPKGWEIERETLINLWMAEGFLGPPSNIQKGRSIEDIGEEYLDCLVWSSFLNVVELKSNEFGGINTYKMHDLVHDLAQEVVGIRECATVRVSELENTKSDARRVQLIPDGVLSESSSQAWRSKVKKLRTIIILEPNSNLKGYPFSCNKKLRVIHFGRAVDGRPGIHFPAANKLKHLRYLYLEGLNLKNVNMHDHSISKLYNLQTLVLSMCTNVQILLENMGSLNNLRSLNISDSDIKNLPDSVTSLPNLQSLDLNYCRSFTSFPTSVTGLKCLKYLHMSATPIKELPGFIINLRDLQTLDVSFCEKLKSLPKFVASLANLRIFNFQQCSLLEALPNDFGSLKQLRYLNLSGTEIKVLPESCTNLNSLEHLHLGKCEVPKEVTNWINLRSFYHDNMEASAGIGKLVMLQQLVYTVREQVINEPERNVGIEELGNLNILESLDIRNLQNVKDPIDAERANLKGKHNLRELYLRWGEETEEELGMMSSSRWDQKSCNFQVFEALQPPAGLRELGIRNFLGSDLPSWMCAPSGLQNLESLELKNCCKGIKQLSAFIGQLPRLQYLSLKKMPLKSLNICGFPSLMYLKLADMLLLEELTYSYPPCLRNLWIAGCKSLAEIPSFPILEYLELYNVDHKLVCSVGRNQTSLTDLKLLCIDELIYLPMSILQNNCNLQDLYIIRCNQLEGFAVNADENDNKVALPVLDLYTGSLRHLFLGDCPVLKFLPDLRGCTSLQQLDIKDCPQVKESLTYDLKSLTFLKALFVDFIQRDEQRRDLSNMDGLINLINK